MKKSGDTRLFTFVQIFGMKRNFLFSVQKDKMSSQNRSKNIILKTLILSFFSQSRECLFILKKLHECEQLICVGLQKKIQNFS